MEGIRKDNKSRPYRVDFFNWDEMQKDMALVRSAVLRTCTAREAKDIVMGAPVPMNNKVLSKISYAGHPWRSIIRAYRFYRKLADEPVRKTYVAVENLFPGKKAVDVMEYIAANKDKQGSRPTTSTTVMVATPVMPNVVPGVWTDAELNDPETWKGICDNETLDMVDERVTALKNWAIEAITGVKRSVHQQVTVEENAMLNSGIYTDANGKIMLFTLPKELEELLAVELRNLMADVDEDEVLNTIIAAEIAAEKRDYLGDVTSTISFHIPQPDLPKLCPSTFSPDIVKAYSIEAQFPDGVIVDPEPPTTGPDSPATKAVVEDLNGMIANDKHEQMMDTFVPQVAAEETNSGMVRGDDRTLSQMEFETATPKPWSDDPPPAAPSKDMYPCEKINGFIWLGVSAAVISGLALWCLFHR
jgi:hypothetical protein